MDRRYNVGGYVKLAKLWERAKDAAVAYHSSYYAEKFRDDADKRLVGVLGSPTYICVLQRKDRKSIAITPCTAEHPMSFKVPDRLLTDGQCRMMINGIQFIQALLEANELAVGKDHQFKGRYEAEKNAVIISLEKDEREW